MIRNSRSKKNKNIFQIKYKRNLVDKIVNQSVVRAHNNGIISRKSGQKIPKIANLQYYKSKANYGTKKKGISR